MQTYKQERWLSYAKKSLIKSSGQQEQIWKAIRLVGCFSLPLFPQSLGVFPPFVVFVFLELGLSGSSWLSCL
jgi:hypothetical protein